MVVMVYQDSKTYFVNILSCPPLIYRRWIDRNSLVPIDNMAWKISLKNLISNMWLIQFSKFKVWHLLNFNQQNTFLKFSSQRRGSKKILFFSWSSEFLHNEWKLHWGPIQQIRIHLQRIPIGGSRRTSHQYPLTWSNSKFWEKTKFF